MNGSEWDESDVLTEVELAQRAGDNRHIVTLIREMRREDGPSLPANDHHSISMDWLSTEGCRCNIRCQFSVKSFFFLEPARWAAVCGRHVQTDDSAL
jgi:hypothetical protein